MPDTRRHRGPHPEDARGFAAEAVAALASAVEDASWLLSRGYGERAVLELVGNRFELTRRQRSAVLRCAGSDASGERRRRSEVASSAVAGESLRLDGYNLLITVESALSGAVVLEGRDGCLRDLASIHSTYRSVEETGPALEAIGRRLEQLRPARVRWHLDAPVSNSARLAARVRELARARGWPWEAELNADPDALLAASGDVVATSDRRVLDAGVRWVNLAREVIRQEVPGAWLLRLGCGGGGAGPGSGRPPA